MRELAPLLLTLCAVLAAPASAQRVQAYQDRKDAQEVAKPSSNADDLEAEAQRVMNDYAACILKRDRSAVERVLERLPTKATRPDYVGLADDDCLSSATLSFQTSIFRGSLFEALYAEDFKNAAPLDFVAVPAIDYSMGLEGASADFAQNQIALRQFADCVVRQRGAGARALILSEVTSDAEAAAFKRLMPALSGCLPQGLQLKFSKPVLRGLIAETAYRLSRAANATDMGGGEK